MLTFRQNRITAVFEMGLLATERQMWIGNDKGMRVACKCSYPPMTTPLQAASASGQSHENFCRKMGVGKKLPHDTLPPLPAAFKACVNHDPRLGTLRLRSKAYMAFIMMPPTKVGIQRESPQLTGEVPT